MKTGYSTNHKKKIVKYKHDQTKFVPFIIPINATQLKNEGVIYPSK